MLVVTIPDKGDDKYKYNIAVAVNVQQVHAVLDKKWECKACREGPPPTQASVAPAAAQ